ncbi:MAG: hypothetical protein RL154_1482 [Pseudomonadota bacterium]|jgi:acyl-CoA thioester hydrolase
MKIRVYYEDTDIGGVVYYANYFKFIERARSEIFFAHDLSPFNSHGHFIVKKIDADFLSSAKLGDLLGVKTSLTKTSKVSVELFQEVLLGEKVLFKANVLLAYIDENAKLKRVPQDIIDLLSK